MTSFSSQGQKDIRLPKIFDMEKKSKFGISDTGEFEENIYRELDSFKLIGQLVGRSSYGSHDKKEFTSIDIAIKGYLYKRGSWVKNWKRRYFILRNDIKTLSYFESSENLKMLGSISLSDKSHVWMVDKRDADQFEHVLAVQGEGDPNLSKAVLIRADNRETIENWYNEIYYECILAKQNFDQLLPTDILKSIFEDSPTVENLPNLLKKGRDGSAGGAGDQSNDNEGKQDNSRKPTVPKEAAHSSLENAQSSTTTLETPQKSTSNTSSDSFTESTVTQSPNPSSTHVQYQNSADLSENKNAVSTTKPQEDEAKDTDSSDDDVKLGADGSKGVIDQYDINPNNVRSYVISKMSPVKRKKRKEDKEEKEKKVGEPPISKPYVDRYVTASKCMAGIQLSVRLFNICSTQDRIFASIFSVSEKKKETSYSQLQLISQTDVRQVYQTPEYGANCVEEVHLQFMICQDPMPPDCKYVMVALYREDTDSSEMPSKVKGNAQNNQAANSRSPKHQPLAQAIIHLRKWNQYPIFNVNLKILVENPVDISSPILARPMAILGVVKLSSFSLAEKRDQLINAWGRNPYAEMLYSFVTNHGQTLSLEQISTSPYGVSVSDAFVQLLWEERIPEITNCLFELNYEDELAATKLSSALKAENASSLEEIYSNNSLLQARQYYESILKSLNSLEYSGTIYKEDMAMVRKHIQACKNGEAFDGMIVPGQCGGSNLRRSCWKKNLKWQYCTVNLNVHTMISRHFSASEIYRYVINPESKIASKSDSTSEVSSLIKEISKIDVNDTNSTPASFMSSIDADSNMHFIPTITLGCPTAHHLKFNNGGLRQIFSEVSKENVLMWMQVIQAPFSINVFTEMIRYFPREFESLFGSEISTAIPISNAAKYEIIAKKIDLAKRIDMCASQILGFAITFVKTILLHAVQAGGSYIETLQRFLKIGILLPLESLLSSTGNELGMIEDLYGASLWLSLVTLRFVQRKQNTDCNSNSGNSASSNRVGSDGCAIGEKKAGAHPANYPTFKKINYHYGISDDVTIRRDIYGRLILDLEVTDKEAAVIKEGYKFMEKFDYPISSAEENKFKVTFTDKTQNELEAFGIDFLPTVGGGAAKDGHPKTQNNSDLRSTPNKDVNNVNNRNAELSRELSSKDAENDFTNFVHKIEICSAKDLPSCNPNRKSDTYVKVLWNGVNVGQTSIIQGTLNPVWENQVIGLVNNVTHTSLQSDSTLSLEVYDWDLMGQSNYLGGCLIPYGELNTWFELANIDIGVPITRKLKLTKLDYLSKSVDQSLVTGRSTIEVSIILNGMSDSQSGAYYFQKSLRYMRNPIVMYHSSEAAPIVIGDVELYSVAFTQGVNEMQSLSNGLRSQENYKQVEINNEALERIGVYFKKYKVALYYQMTIQKPKTDVDKRIDHIIKKSLAYVDLLYDDVKQAAQISMERYLEKHVDVPLKFSALCRKMVSTIGILCKSGKDRTGMGVTLEITRGLVEDVGLKDGEEVCKLLRFNGVRRMNVHANTGQDKFAFNFAQRLTLPVCYQPPQGAYGGNVAS